ncbi:MAG: hypothetical protein NDI69_02995 [Bacteriovoracaceae bacterium]|nr:hypothetical protein [Bacteriovoracaceae bacterium]
MRGPSDERKLRYFEKVNDGWKVKGEDSYHLILCRNVLIYHKIEIKKLVVESLFTNLQNDGSLLLGVGETLLGIIDNPAVVSINSVSFYSRKKNSR